MLVDDSLVARTVMTRILAERVEFEIVATASHAAQAIDLAGRVSADIILLDVNMPGLDGLAALPALLARGDGARVLMVSGCTADGATATVRALTQGAADTLLKPAAADFAGRFADELVERLLRIGHARRGADAAAGLPTPGTRPDPAWPVALGCIALGGSTGGPHAFSTLFAALPVAVTAPILLTQHLPAAFMPYFARQLEDMSGRRVRLAEDGQPLCDGEVLVAPGDGHLRIMRNQGEVRVRLDRSAAASGCTPSVDPMLAAVADVYGPAGLAVILSGMGRDGLIGAGLLAARGGEILVQDAATSVVWGMPGAVAKAGLATAILPPAAIAQRIGERCHKPAGVAAWR
jgi:two-component system chemotaxis response regulator CheB